MMNDSVSEAQKSDNIKFAAAAKKILAHEKVKQMRRYIQHGEVSCYEHCIMVCIYAYMYAKRLNIPVDVDALVKGALLHDMFLYDWHDKPLGELHGFHHPEAARKNAAEHFTLTQKESNIISAHMWPLTLTRLPASKEAWLVCVADKYCSLKETLLKKPYKRS